jgi:hypothetical protein
VLSELDKVLRRPGREAAIFACALGFALSVTAPGAARAQGFFDFLFGGFQQHAPPPEPNSYPPPPAPLGRVAPAPLGQESVSEGGGSTGHAVAYCVRLCDGQHFPLEQMASGTPAETCRAICPYSKTKVFFGSEIGSAVAQDGQHYTSLDSAFVYRKHLVANCTCNGRDALGLVSFDVKTDPTLRPGDIVATKEGLMTYTGQRGQVAQFTPTDPSTLTAELNPAGSRTRVAKKAEPPPADAEEETGTIVQSQNSQSRTLPAVVDARGQALR